MQISEAVLEVLNNYGKKESITWLNQRISKIENSKSGRDLFMTYSLLSSKFDSNEPIDFDSDKNVLVESFVKNNASLLEVSRIYLLIKVLEIDFNYYSAKSS